MKKLISTLILSSVCIVLPMIVSANEEDPPYLERPIPEQFPFLTEGLLGHSRSLSVTFIDGDRYYLYSQGWDVSHAILGLDIPITGVGPNRFYLAYKQKYWQAGLSAGFGRFYQGQYSATNDYSLTSAYFRIQGELGVTQPFLRFDAIRMKAIDSRRNEFESEVEFKTGVTLGIEF